MKLFMMTSIAIIILAGFLAEGSADSLKNLTVSYGFNQFPSEYTCDSMNVSPRIEISGLSGISNVTSVAMILDDPDAPIGTFTHWVIWNMLPANVMPGNIPNVINVTAPIKAMQGANSAGKIGYFGPCPPPGKPHRYFLKVYGLDTMLDLKSGSNKSALEDAMNGHILMQGEAMATYGR
ncbi:MAG: YbhB/YbcL family Raf kinase inhibitor-like protein [Methanotrichaceae archaeon]|nr:YbhB/YbcL family Raf kinase inhibitor-like protein [Methanotrichaceae archaeon]